MGIKVALKYCGGCDPAFDRVAAFEAINQAAAGAIEWSRFDPGQSLPVLIICGCATACPTEELDLSQAAKVVLLTQEPHNMQEIVNQLLENGETA